MKTASARPSQRPAAGEAPPAPTGAAVATSAVWSAADFWVQQFVQLATFIIVGNVIGAEAVGAMAIAYVAVYFATAVLAEGVSDSLIHLKPVTRAHIDTTFWTLLVASLVIVVAYLAAKTAIVDGLNSIATLNWSAGAEGSSSPGLVIKALNILVLAMPLIGVASVLQNILRRELRFRPLAIRSLFANATSFAVAAYLAAQGLTVESLAYGYLVGRIVDVALLVAFQRQFPGFSFSWSALREVWSFGRFRAAHQFIGFLITQVERIIIGIFLGPAALGFFQIANRFVMAALYGIAGVLNRMAFPLLARQKDDRPAFDRQLRNLITYANFVAFPMFAGLALVSDDLIAGLFRDEWAPVARLMPVICILGFLEPVNYLLTSAANALGRAEKVAQLSVMMLAIKIAATLAAVQFGLFWVVAAGVAALALSYPVVAAMTWKEFSGKHLYYLRPTLETAIATIVMTAGVLVLAHVLPDGIGGLLTVSIKAAAGITLYGITSAVIAPRRLQEIWTWASRKI